MSIIPGISNISHPIQIRREEDFYLSSSIRISCNASYRLTYQWKIYNCSSIWCSTSTIIHSNLVATSNEYFLPARSLSLGFYEIELMVTMNLTSLLMNQSQTIYLLINPSGITANLIPLGTSTVTNGIHQDLRFNPGEYSIDLDEDHFNASVSDDNSFSLSHSLVVMKKEWNYDYYCRIYGSAYFPNYLGQLLPIDDPRADQQNLSCFHNQSLTVNGSRWVYDGSGQSIKSALSIFGNSFLSTNRTYEFMVRMTNKRNALQQISGYVLVRIEETSQQMIIIGSDFDFHSFDSTLLSLLRIFI